MSYLKPVLTATMLALALGLPACKSKQEAAQEQSLEQKADTKEDKADVMRKEGEATADRIERQDPGMNARSTDRAADAARESSENRADQLEDQADRLREQK